MLSIFRVDFMAATCEICDCCVCAGFVPCRLVLFVCVRCTYTGPRPHNVKWLDGVRLSHIFILCIPTYIQMLAN